ncbi:hypothetical protein [Haliscomenobacter sp.]|uniref:hypothetical protein n=1 Tax=Haliscomenobacter sp. TaxID=2717303 RepID=UPI003BAC279E
MKLDLIFFDEKMLVSKETRDWRVWQEKLHFYKASLTFGDKVDFFEYIKLDYNLTDKDIKIIDETLLDKSNKYFFIDFVSDKENKVKVTKSSLDFLGNKGELVYWEDWYWVLTKHKDEFYLWVYLGGIAEIVREIRLSENQKNDFLIFGKPFIEKLAEQLQAFNSTLYAEAITENRKVV